MLPIKMFHPCRNFVRHELKKGPDTLQNTGRERKKTVRDFLGTQ